MQLPKNEFTDSKVAVRPSIINIIVDKVHDLEIGKKRKLRATNNCPSSSRGIGFLNVHWFVVIDGGKVVA